MVIDDYARIYYTEMQPEDSQEKACRIVANALRILLLAERRTEGAADR
jgi:hypothetical protein